MKDLWVLCDLIEEIGIATVAEDTTIIRCNDAFAHILGEDKIHIQKRSIMEFTAPSDRERAKVSFNGLFTGQTTRVTHNKTYIKSNGTQVTKRLQTILLKSKGTPFLFSIVYDHSTIYEKRIKELEKTLIDMKQPLRELTFNMSGQDNSQNIKGNNNTQTRGLASTNIVSIAAILAVLILGVTVAITGSKLLIKHNETTIEVQE